MFDHSLTILVPEMYQLRKVAGVILAITVLCPSHVSVLRFLNTSYILACLTIWKLTIYYKTNNMVFVITEAVKLNSSPQYMTLLSV